MGLHLEGFLHGVIDMKKTPNGKKFGCFWAAGMDNDSSQFISKGNTGLIYL